MNSIHVVHVISGLPLGGAQTALKYLIARMDRGLFRNTVISLTTKGIVGSQIEALDVPVIEFGMPRGIPSVVGFFRLVRELRQLQPQLIQTWMYHADLLGLLAARSLGLAPIVWNVRGARRSWRGFGLRTGLTVKTCALLSRAPTVVVVNSVQGKDDHRDMGYRPKRWEVIPNGIDVDRFQPNPGARAKMRAELGVDEGDLLIGTVARFHPMKGHEALLEAIGRSRKKFLGLHLALVGEGLEEGNSRLMNWACLYNVDEGLHLMGPREDIPEILNALDIFVLSSYGEGFPNVVGEAMSSGVPCVVTDVGDSARLVGDSGVVVSPGDAMALESGLNTLIEVGAEARSRMGAMARERVVSSYDVNAMIGAYEQLYSGLLKPA
jgi:glycosyltransferase involved in cell wall biosynthesis